MFLARVLKINIFPSAATGKATHFLIVIGFETINATRLFSQTNLKYLRACEKLLKLLINVFLFRFNLSVLKNAFDAFDQEKKGCIGTTMVKT